MLAFNFGSAEHFWSKSPKFLPCCAVVCPWEQFQDMDSWFPLAQGWSLLAQGCSVHTTTPTLVQMNPPINTCSMDIRSPVPPVCSLDLCGTLQAKVDRPSVLFSQYDPLFGWWRTMTNGMEHLPWLLITGSKSRWYLLLLFMVVVKHLQSGDTSCPQRLALSVLSLPDSGYANIPKEVPEGKCRWKNNQIFNLGSDVWKVVISKVGLAPVAVLSSVLMSLPPQLSHFHSTCLFGWPEMKGKALVDDTLLTTPICCEWVI